MFVNRDEAGFQRWLLQEAITGKETIGVAGKHYGTIYENNTGGKFDCKQADQFVSYFVKKIEQAGNLGA